MSTRLNKKQKDEVAVGFVHGGIGDGRGPASPVAEPLCRRTVRHHALLRLIGRAHHG